jgi:hypothetical protein
MPLANETPTYRQPTQRWQRDEGRKALHKLQQLPMDLTLSKRGTVSFDAGKSASISTASAIL